MGFSRLHNTIRHYTQKYTTLKQNTEHKATQTIKNTLHTMNITQKKKKSRAIPVTGSVGL
jgi:hypothetical protein